MLPADKTGPAASVSRDRPSLGYRHASGARGGSRSPDGRQWRCRMRSFWNRPAPGAAPHGALRDRTPTPLRLFCRPFEDILSSTPRAKKLKACVARTSVLPVWLWVTRTLAPEESQSFISDVKKLILAQKLEDARLRAAQFWTLAAEKIHETLSSDAGRKAARVALNGDVTLADAEEIGLLAGRRTRRSARSRPCCPSRCRT